MTGPVRAFFALPLDPGALERVSACIDALRLLPDSNRVRFVRPENLHVTVRFLGAVDPALLDAAAAQVARELQTVAPFTCQLDRIVAFPNPRRPAVIAIGFAREPRLDSVAACVERAVVAAGAPPETRPFRAHLTLGRVRGRPIPAVAGLAPLATPLVVDRIVAYRSELTPAGPLYTALHTAPLAGEADS